MVSGSPLSIAIPTYCREHELAALIACLAEQIGERRDIHVLVSDNASTDGTDAYLRAATAQYDWLDSYRQASNLGGGANFQWVLKHAAEAEMLWLIGDDDVLEPGALDHVLAMVEEHHPAWLYLPHRWVTADGRVVHTILDVLSVTDRRGRAVALEGRLRNVTDERRDKVESALAEAILEDVPERLDATQLAQRTCERLVAMAEAEMAWFGVPLDDGTVQIVASEGDSEYLENLQVRWDDGPLSLGPAGIAIRERRPIAMTPDQPGYEAWRARAFNARLTASLAVPLTHEQAVVGVLVVSSRFGNPFDDAHIARFTRTADRLAIVLAATGQELDASTTRRTRLAPEHTWFDLPAALDAGRIEVWWQPQVASADGRIVAVEALVRGRTEAGEVVLPSVILPEAERAGLMVRLGRQLRRLAVEQAPQWLALGVERVALNASISELHEPGFALELAELVDRHSLDRDCIEVELVESAPLDMRAARAVAELSISGFRIAVDDYGSGWASLGHLAQLPATTLKIDRVFVRDLGTSNRADQLVRSTFELARTLGLTAVAEGVETVAQAHALASMGCELHQGFLFARPMPTIEFDRLLRHHREHRPASWAGPLLPDA